MTLALLLSGLGLALVVGGAHLLVQGAAALARHLGISSLAIGLTVVAFGTSSPELAVGLRSALAGSSDLALGNVVGSNVFNVLCILGVSALIAPLAVDSRLVRRDVPVMILASGLLWGLCANGRLGRVEGLALAALLVFHTAGSLRHERRTYGSGESRTEDREAGGRSWALELLSVVAGLVLLTVGADAFVHGARRAAAAFGVSDLVIGLTLVAVGTSIPELATSIVASLRHAPQIAVGNIVGSNLFNILGVGGLSASISPTGLSISAPALNADIPVMTVAAIACLPIFFTGWKISRLEGVCFLACYSLYAAYLWWVGSHGPSVPPLDRTVVLGAGSIVAIALAAGVVREKPWRKAR